MKNYNIPEGKVLVLRTCAGDMTSYGGFKWPESGPVECPDWNPTPACGHGLHGLLWGEGDGSLLDWSPEAKWLVVEVAAKDVVAIDSAKVKFPRGVVVYCGMRHEATQMIAARAPHGVTIVGLTSTSGDEGTSTSGYGGTSTSGDWGTSTSGDEGTSTSGYGGTSTSGYGGTIIIKWWDYEAERYRFAIGYVGEDGIEANTPYRVEGRGKLVKA